MVNKVRIQNFLFFSALVLLLIGGFGFLRGFVTTMNAQSLEKTTQKLPLGGLEGVIIDNSGRIYCVSNFYGRVQVYDANGRFMYGLKVGTVQDIYFDKDQNLMVQTKGNILNVFNQQGIIISQSENEAEYGDLASKRINFDEFGNQYKIKSPVLFPHITQITPGGKERIIVANSFWEWLLAGPLPAWLFFAMGISIFFILFNIPSELNAARKKREEARRSGKPMIEV